MLANARRTSATAFALPLSQACMPRLCSSSRMPTHILAWRIVLRSGFSPRPASAGGRAYFHTSKHHGGDGRPGANERRLALFNAGGARSGGQLAAPPQPVSVCHPEWGSVSSPSSSASWGAAKRFSAACRTSGRRYEPRRRQHAGGRAALLIRSSSGGRAIVTTACRAAPHGSSTAPLPSASRSSSSAAAAHAARKKPRAKCDRAVQACPAACMAALASDVSSSDRVLGTCARARAAVWHIARPHDPGVSQHQ